MKKKEKDVHVTKFREPTFENKQMQNKKTQSSDNKGRQRVKL